MSLSGCAKGYLPVQDRVYARFHEVCPFLKSGGPAGVDHRAALPTFCLLPLASTRPLVGGDLSRRAVGFETWRVVGERVIIGCSRAYDCAPDVTGFH